MKPWFILDNARRWLRRTAIVGSQLLEASAREIEEMRARAEQFKVPGFKPADLVAAGRRRRDWADDRLCAQHFFLIAMGKALVWLEQARSVDPALAGPIDAFSQQFPEARLIRNMNEHDDAYLRGTGHHQGKFLHTIAASGDPNAIGVDGTSSLVEPEGYLIGGRLNVNQVVEAAERLSTIIEAAEDQLARLPPHKSSTT